MTLTGFVLLYIAATIAIGVIAILMVFILPQLYTSITDIVDRLPVWYNNLTTMVDNFENRHADLGFIDYNLINEHLTSLYPKIISYLTDTLANLLHTL